MDKLNLGKESVAALFSQHYAALPENERGPVWAEWEKYISLLYRAYMVEDRAFSWKCPVQLNTEKRVALAKRLHGQYKEALAVVSDLASREASKEEAVTEEVEAPDAGPAPEGIEQPKDPLQEYLDELTEVIKKEVCSYADLNDADAFLFHALVREVGKTEESFSCAFKEIHGRRMSPNGDLDFFRRLMVNNGGHVVVIDPSASEAGAFSREEDGKVYYLWDKVCFRVVPDLSQGTSLEAFKTFVEKRTYRDGKSLRELWFTYAEKECVAYLQSQVDVLGIFLSDDSWARTRAALRVLLEQLSIAEVWSAIWKVVRDASDLSYRPYYSRSSAADAIPGKLVRHLERIRSGQAVAKSWVRTVRQSPGAMGELFHELFGLNENTSGPKARDVFERLELGSPLTENEMSDEDLRHFLAMELQYAREANNVSEFLFDLVKAMKATGGEVVAAIDILDQKRLAERKVPSDQAE